MNTKHCRRKLDLFSVLLIVVALGMTATLAHQINVYYGGDQAPFAERATRSALVGG